MASNGVAHIVEAEPPESLRFPLLVVCARHQVLVSEAPEFRNFFRAWCGSRLLLYANSDIHLHTVCSISINGLSSYTVGSGPFCLNMPIRRRTAKDLEPLD